MSKSFTDCVKNGGKVRTKNLKGDRYIKICYDKDGKSHAGEVMKRDKGNRPAKQKDTPKKLKVSLAKLKEHYNEHYHSE